MGVDAEVSGHLVGGPERAKARRSATVVAGGDSSAHRCKATNKDIRSGGSAVHERLGLASDVQSSEVRRPSRRLRGQTQLADRREVDLRPWRPEPTLTPEPTLPMRRAVNDHQHRDARGRAGSCPNWPRTSSRGARGSDSSDERIVRGRPISTSN